MDSADLLPVPFMDETGLGFRRTGLPVPSHLLLQWGFVLLPHGARDVCRRLQELHMYTRWPLRCVVTYRHLPLGFSRHAK